MSRRIIPFTRLSIVFILAMVLSGGVLTYFSINNISNLKELTEKRILEEQQKLASRFANSLQESLEKLSSELVFDPVQASPLNDILIQSATKHDFIIQAFILENIGTLIFPNFTGISDESSEQILSDRFKAAYQQGEKSEFTENDLIKAENYYQSCLGMSSGATDSVTALNALGRISVKSGDMEKANGYYMSIIHDYFQQSDRNGFPFAYYALFHLVSHSYVESIEEIIPVIEFCLAKMEYGFIPLNYQTGEIINQVADWSKEYRVFDSIQFSQIDRFIKSIQQQIQFVNLYGDELEGIGIEGNPNNQYADQNGFRIEPLYSEGDPQFLIFKETHSFNVGFLIDRNNLFDTLVNAGLQEELEFDYRFHFPVGYHSNTSENNLLYFSQLNPFFPEHTMQITIRDEDVISDLIKRRSWIYGIASVLLLVAMLLGIILTLRDISREKHLANLRSDFISNVTHELKTPLTSIRMYAESLMMRRVRSLPGQRKYLSVVINESERLKRMINNILEFSKMEKAKQEYHLVESNLSEILQTAILDMNYWLEKNGFELKKEIETDIKAIVDPEKFYQVYSNLLSNAIKYSGDSRNIFVRLYKNGNSVVTEVEDEGIGISQENQVRIFEEFYRVEKHQAGNITGTGLGLTVVNEIVEAHQGKIVVESEIGKGSKFSVILFQQSTDENHSDHRG